MATVIWGRADTRQKALEHELDRLVQLLSDLPGIRDVWVFGSLVSGHIHAGSDIDLLVIRDTQESGMDRVRALWHELRPSVPTDLFVYTPAEVAQGGRFLDFVQANGRKLL